MAPGLLVSKFIAQLNLNHSVEVLAQKFWINMRKVFTLSGKDLKGLVAPAIYIADINEKTKISQTKIAKAIGITEVTLKIEAKEIQKFIKDII